MKFIADSDAGRWTARMHPPVSKKFQAANGYKIKTPTKNTPKKKVVVKAKPEPPMTEEEKLLRDELGLCYRSLYSEGIYEGCDTHLSLCLDNQDAFLTLPYGILWSTVKSEDFVLCSYGGEVLRQSGRWNDLTGEPHGPDITAVALHGPMHAKLGRPRGKAVFHTHQHFGTVLACSQDYELQMIHQNSARFYKSVIYDRDFSGLADSFEEGNRIADHFLAKGNSTKRVLTQHHHGIFIIGEHAANAVDDVYYFEKACKIQVEMMKMGQCPKKASMSEESARYTYEQGSTMPEKRWYCESLMNAWREAEAIEAAKTGIHQSPALTMAMKNSVKAINRPAELQANIFSSFDNLAIPNIYTFKPSKGQTALSMHDYKWYQEQLKKHGHIILKNTGIQSAEDFNNWGSKFIKQRSSYKGGQNPRDDLGNGVLNVNTAEPPHISLAFHNEMCYHNSFPSKVVFCCFKKSEEGGITTLLDSVKMSRQMPAHITDKFKKHGVKYILNMQNMEAFEDGREPLWYNQWQRSFGVKTKEEMSKMLDKKEGYSYEWKENDFLKISFVNSGLIKYDKLGGELLHLHQIIVSSAYYWDDIEGYKDMPLHDRPCHALWGNDEELSYEEEKTILELNKKFQMTVPYEEGDIFLIDNIMVAHGRTPFTGARKIGVMLGDEINRDDFEKKHDKSKK